jgi:large subunit ribosomal protein L3
VQTDEARGLIMIRGAIPGAPGNWVLIRDAVKKKQPKDLPFPAALRGTGQAAAPAGEADQAGA